MRDRSDAPVTNPFVADLLSRLESILLDARSLTDSLSRDQINWHPAPGRWSIAQCLDHLTRTVRLYDDAIPRMIEDARSRQAAGAKPYREGFLSRWIIRTIEPPARLRVRTIRSVEPSAGYDPAVVLADFDKAHGWLRDEIIAADGVSLRHARMPSPFVKQIRFTLGQVFAINLAHARRHLWQARRVRQHPEFPRSTEPTGGGPPP